MHVYYIFASRAFYHHKIVIALLHVSSRNLIILFTLLVVHFLHFSYLYSIAQYMHGEALGNGNGVRVTNMYIHQHACM